MFFWYRWIAQTLLPLTEQVRLKKKSISCRSFDFSGLGASSFHSERISAQRATGACSTPLPGLIFVIVFIRHTPEILLSHQK
jgi:hypothetical protein